MLALARAITTLAILSGFATLVAAQTVSGIVVRPDSATPASGVIVVASDLRGVTVGRALTNTRGQFSVALPGPGQYGFALLRIGFLPTRIPAVTFGAGATDGVRLVLEDHPVVLSSINVRERETCRVSADTGFMVARVWEEARKAMLSTQLTSGGAPLFAEWITYDRVLDSSARVVRDQRVHVVRNPTTHAFQSRPAQVLDTSGYVIADNTGTTYFAPDAEVLLSDLFAAAHCFRLVAPRSGAGANLIGVSFQPTRERRDRSEIEGTLWVDRSTAELRTLEFEYTNVPDVIRLAGAGGVVEFLRLADGNWLVSRWHIRMPRVSASSRYSAGGFRQVTPATRVVSAIQVTGGEVTRVTRHDTLVHEATGPSIQVQVVSHDTLVPTAAAGLTLEGTDYAARADASGRIRLTPVLAGRYRARVSTPLMDSLGLRAVVREVEAREDAHVDSLDLPSARDVVAAACPRDSVAHGEGMLYGRVRDERARALASAAVTITWQSGFSAIGTRDGGQLSYTEQTLGALTNESGYWRVCGVPRQASLAVRVATDSGSDSRRARLAEDQEFGAVDLVIQRGAVAAGREIDAAVTAGKEARPRALVEIAVTELGGSSLPNSTVEIVGAGQKRTVVTGSTGRALVPDIAPGLLVVHARHVGFQAGQFAITVEAGRNTVPIILSRASLPTLDTVRVVGNHRMAGLGRLDEFETRRLNHTATASFSREDILKRNPVEAWQMLRNVASVRIIDSSGVTAESARSMRLRPDLSVEPCYFAVMIDGSLMTDPGSKAFDLRQLPKPEEIHGIEVFAGAASIPLQYGGISENKSCGLIAVWTR